MFSPYPCFPAGMSRTGASALCSALRGKVRHFRSCSRNASQAAPDLAWGVRPVEKVRNIGGWCFFLFLLNANSVSYHGKVIFSLQYPVAW
ncbi:hypothetical protein ANCCAN_06683 [Ancylostoma caninum]|uniref:Uncharacterized protein n=1 Tax=Ancylostoma caninum TaxID=29170 RepID=A0A368GS84_ANCCA|nr:hypothetical protein ANCCAN_06683 [Ancylostoma caninum]